MTLSGVDETITATSIKRHNKTVQIAADKDAAGAAEPGQCVSLQVETAANGAARIAASQPRISISNLSSCGGLQRS